MFLLEWPIGCMTSDVTYDVPILSHMTSKKVAFFQKKNVVKKVKVKGYSQGQGQMKVNGQGHDVIFWSRDVKNVYFS